MPAPRRRQRVGGTARAGWNTACHGPGVPSTPPGRSTARCPRQRVTRASKRADVRRRTGPLRGSPRPARRPAGPGSRTAAGWACNAAASRSPSGPVAGLPGVLGEGVEGVSIGSAEGRRCGPGRRPPRARGWPRAPAARRGVPGPARRRGSTLCGSCHGARPIAAQRSGSCRAPARAAAAGSDRRRRPSPPASGSPDPRPGRGEPSRPGRRGCARAEQVRPGARGGLVQRRVAGGAGGGFGAAGGAHVHGGDHDRVEAQAAQDVRDFAERCGGPFLQPVVDRHRAGPERGGAVLERQRSGQRQGVGSPAAGREDHRARRRSARTVRTASRICGDGGVWPAHPRCPAPPGRPSDPGRASSAALGRVFGGLPHPVEAGHARPGRRRRARRRPRRGTGAAWRPGPSAGASRPRPCVGVLAPALEPRPGYVDRRDDVRVHAVHDDVCVTLEERHDRRHLVEHRLLLR